MSRADRIALCLSRIGDELPNLAQLIHMDRARSGEPEELLVAAARIEGALPGAGAIASAEIALLFLAAGDFARARRHANHAIEREAAPEVEARGRALLGRLDEVAGDLNAALGHYRTAAVLCPRSWRHQMDLAAILVALPDPLGWAEAGEALSVASALAGDAPPLELVRAQLMIRQGEADHAARALRELAASPDVSIAASATRLLSTLPLQES